MPWESLPTELIKHEQQCWNFQPDAKWHGYAGYADGYAMVDPNKLMLLTPGIDRATGDYLDFGVPATVVANFLREQRIVPEKCDLNSILFLMTPAEDESKLNSLIAKLVKFKALWDADAPLQEVLPSLLRGATASATPARRSGRCATRCTASTAARNIKELQRRCFRAESFPELAMSPQDAYRALVGNEVDYLPLDAVQGPRLGDAGADLPAGHRRRGAGRALGRSRAADARLPARLRGIVQPLPRLQLRSAGRVPGTGGRAHRLPHLRGARVAHSAHNRQGEPSMAEQQKKMNVVQLTFIVTVNMMGSGIIMLPANMAQVGAISLLSWIVTALGSLAIAYGFAQAGLFSKRSGGLAGYAEDAYGKDGYFQVFFLYFISLAIANVAVASSALGYLAAFFPWMASTPVFSCISIIALLWLTTVANFGGPSLTGKIGSVTVWGVILPVGFISIAGWFWFSGATFSAAWNPKGISLAEGMGSSISLTLWAFLGMESASQNASAVENPKRDVPLACMFGTLGAAVIYILSTTVIQGIVPNAELAESSGPFGLAFAKMFNPMVGQIVMALAAMACVGSLLGWQFTLSSTAKDAADANMFPKIFGKVTGAGAPIAGMVIMGIVQSVMALSTISPNLSEQFAALVNLAVVTNVVPYIISLSALFVMMRDNKVEPGVFKRNAFVAVVAMVYSVYALWASGKDAVMGGMLVMGIGYIVYGFIAPRFVAAPAVAGRAA